MRDSLVICTKDRSQDLDRALTSIQNLLVKPFETLVVDQSSNLETRKIVSEHRGRGNIPNLRYILCPGSGLTRSRNWALRHLDAQSKVVHFVDDDVELHPEYLVEIQKAFEENKSVVGVCGEVEDRYSLQSSDPKFSSSNALKRLLGFAGKPGAVLWTGINTPVPIGTPQSYVDWLPGCSMSFLIEKISSLKFDERRSGYALGEDVDFSLRCLRFGRLLYAPSAKLKHHLSPVNRESQIALVSAGVAHRWLLSRDKLGRVSKVGVIISTALLFVRWRTSITGESADFSRLMSQAILNSLQQIFLNRKTGA